MSERKGVRSRNQSLFDALNLQEAHELSKLEVPEGYQSEISWSGKTKHAGAKAIGAINNHAERGSESAIENSFQVSQSTKNLDSRLSSSPKCNTPSSRIQSLLPSSSRGSGVRSTVTLISGEDSKAPPSNSRSVSSNRWYLPIPPMYEDLPESSRWPSFYDLEINEGIRDSLTALSMVEFKEATLVKQLRKPWACFSTTTLGYDPRYFKPLSHFTGKSEEESQPWFQSLHYTFTQTVNSGVKRPRSPVSNTKQSETKRKRAGECDIKNDMICSGSPPITENKHVEEIAPTLSESSAEPRPDKSSDSIGRQKKKDLRVVEEWDKLELKKISSRQRSLLRKAAESNPELLDKLDESDSRKSWMLMSRRDVPKAYRAWQAASKKQMQEYKRIAELCKREVRMRAVRTSRESMKTVPTMKKLCRDMLSFWRRVDKEVADIRKQEEKAAAEQRKIREEEIEEKRQAQKLNFLLNKTELYSHFMAHKLGASSLPISVNTSDVDDPNLLRKATIAAKAAVQSTAERMKKFDVEYSKAHEKSGSRPNAGGRLDRESLQNPSSMPTSSNVQQPPGFKGQLKAYQLKGLQWLVNLYEQGLNGILADEMGLGKTIQAIAFMAYLAEKKNIWGPFLVVTPSSTLHNWDSELSHFFPSFKVLPYWGTQQDRKILRQSFNPRKIYSSDPSFNVTVTSYQLLIQDETYLKRVKWQYMILDEAQAIKSSASVRWKTLLAFSCRNRILLTGTPIQNNLTELWALLHFIMPALFDSMEQFNGWFSKGLEQFVEGSHELNNAQLKRLHSLLSPFMLRRVKTDVAGEMVSKHERVVYCDLSRRQQVLYKALRENVNLADLFNSDRKKIASLMNLVIQLRKVCNHPELFEEQTERASWHFAQPSVSLTPPSFGVLPWINHSGSQSHISFCLPRLVYREGVISGRSALSGSPENFRSKWLRHLFLVYQQFNAYQSLFGGTFGFARMIGLSLSDIHFFWAADPLQSWSYLQQSSSNLREKVNFWEHHYDSRDQDGRIFPVRTLRFLLVDVNASVDAMRSTPDDADAVGCGPLVKSPEEKLYSMLDVVKRVRPGFVHAVLAPPPSIHCSDRHFANVQKSWQQSIWLRNLLFGASAGVEMPCYPAGSPPHLKEVSTRMLENPPDPSLMWPLYRGFGSAPPTQSYALAKSLVDSGKMLKLDDLLRKLKAEKHRVLLFSQMTMMMNILVDYLNFRRYKFLRLDGQSSISDRRDMVNAFQTNPSIFVFLLSTRAGGLGINLTAADTVIFFESDWNPTMDMQAMDRAHRLGQTRDVTVYRLICRNTIEEKILQRAKEKSTVQQLVMTGQANTGDLFAPEEVASLLLEAEGSIPLEKFGRSQQKNSKSLAKIYMYADNMEIASLASTKIDNDF